MDTYINTNIDGFKVVYSDHSGLTSYYILRGREWMGCLEPSKEHIELLEQINKAIKTGNFNKFDSEK